MHVDSKEKQQQCLSDGEADGLKSFFCSGRSSSAASRGNEQPDGTKMENYLSRGIAFSITRWYLEIGAPIASIIDAPRPGSRDTQQASSNNDKISGCQYLVSVAAVSVSHNADACKVTTFDRIHGQDSCSTLPHDQAT